MKQVRVKIHGLVQGVFFRDNTRKQARAFNILGWVKNNPDGTVSAVFAGESEAVDKIVAWCHKGPDSAQVGKVEVSEEESTGEFTSFEILH
jgi:acylphosphatase